MHLKETIGYPVSVTATKGSTGDLSFAVSSNEENATAVSSDPLCLHSYLAFHYPWAPIVSDPPV
jgi:hypothetical protein